MPLESGGVSRAPYAELESNKEEIWHTPAPCQLLRQERVGVCDFL